ncbi:MAG: membrane fusion protein (multidrug efflux system) [Limisphaerales bacterium]|jgi:membrane fusion protein (multidrug efflux system)
MRWVSWLVVIVVCALVGAGLGYYKYTEIQSAMAQARAFPEPFEAVEYHIVEQIQRTPSLSVTGEVVATRSAELRTELKGRVSRVGFDAGARVSEGQVLLQLDVTQEKAQLAEAAADQKIARLALDRAQRLVRSGAGSAEVRDQARARYEGAGARLRALQAVIDKKTVVAPFDGIGGLHELQVGQYLDAGFAVTELVAISEQVWVDFSLPQEHADLVVGSQVQVERDSLLLNAQIIARDATVNTRSRNLRIRAELPDPQGLLLPGMLVQVVVDLGETRMATVVPATAVRRDALGTSVYVLDDVLEGGKTKTRARKRKVEIGQLTDLDQSNDVAVVVSGLEVGERIAGIGAFKLRDGSLVVAQAPNLEATNRAVGH